MSQRSFGRCYQAARFRASGWCRRFNVSAFLWTLLFGAPSAEEALKLMLQCLSVPLDAAMPNGRFRKRSQRLASMSQRSFGRCYRAPQMSTTTRPVELQCLSVPLDAAIGRHHPALVSPLLASMSQRSFGRCYSRSTWAPSPRSPRFNVSAFLWTLLYDWNRAWEGWQAKLQCLSVPLDAAIR